MRSRARPGQPDAAAAPGTASPAAGRPPGLRLIAAMLIAAAALDLTRCSLVLITFRHVAPAVGLIAAGIGAAVVSGTAARGYQARQRWAAWAALLIGVASAPQASASGFDSPYVIPDVATVALGVLLTVTILATAGRPGQPEDDPAGRAAVGERHRQGVLGPAGLGGSSRVSALWAALHPASLTTAFGGIRGNVGICQDQNAFSDANVGH